MKAIAELVLALLPLSALAQQAPGSSSDSSSRRSTSGYGVGTPAVGSGYGTGTGYGWSPASGYFWGTSCVYPWRPGIVSCPGWGFPGYGYGGDPGSWGGDWGWNHPAAASVAGPAAPAAPALDRSPASASAREIEEGRRRFRSGDYRAAVDAFRAAVIAQPESPLAQGWFSVALAAVGEGRNADKALRSAAASGLPAGALTLDGLFRDEKERVRLIVALAKVGGDGGLAAAYALSLAGEPVRLKQLAEKDPVARQLLPKP